jgi:hypothetical protein
MIIIQLIGGLGNQMFQYALGRSLSLKRHVPFALDISPFVTYRLRTYRLSFFTISGHIASQDQINTIRDNPCSRLKSKLWSRHIFPYHKLNYLIEEYEKYYTFDPGIFTIPEHAYLEGFWQSYAYFQDIGPVLRNDFSLKADPGGPAGILREKIEQTDSVSLHIRRGDYVTDPTVHQVHGTCSLDYYREAIDRITDAVEKPHFFIFSDDISWAKHHLKMDYPVNYVSDTVKEDYLELTLMRSCKYHIIANSSFSWWGAWLAAYPDKIVCAPAQWVNNRQIFLGDLLPADWIRL